MTETAVAEKPTKYTPSTEVLDDLKDRAKRIAGLIEAAVICERLHNDGGDYITNAEDFCNAITGSIGAASGEIANLRNLLRAIEPIGAPEQ